MYESRSRSSEDKDKVRRWHGRNLHTHRHIREILFSEDDGHTYLQGSAFVYIFANDMRTLSENENERVREHVFVFVYAILFGLGLPSGVPPQKKMTLRNLGGHAGSGGRGH